MALVNVLDGQPVREPAPAAPFEYPPPDGYETPEHPLIGVDRHFRLTAAIQRPIPISPSSARAIAGSRPLPSRPARRTCARAGPRSWASAAASLAQPDFGRQPAGRRPLDPKRLCRTFSYCTALMRQAQRLGQFATGCPPFDKDVYGPIWDEAKG